ncbi:MAG TPA: hypothetical protein DDW41_02645 [Candidatus Andersenbacteria bacterium]|nr:hypothetical protein [Candidatus Andersenbacteria bacterium]
MARRCVTINLAPQLETPATRQFAANPLARVKNARAQHVALALTIIRAWLAGGGPITACQSVASFGQWSQWVRQPLLCKVGAAWASLLKGAGVLVGAAAPLRMAPAA